MGEGALTSHANGKKHQTKVMDLEMARNFFKPKTTSAEVKKQSENLTKYRLSHQAKIAKQLNQMSPLSFLHQKHQLMQDSFVQKAEIMWALKQVYSGLSDNSCKNIVRLFQSMFPDSQIEQKMRLQPIKLKYMVNHEIAPNVKDILRDDVRKSEVHCIV